MNISKKDALEWFEFLASIPGDKKEIIEKYDIVVGSVFRQMELAVNDKIKKLQDEIPNLENLKGRTYFVGDKNKFPKGCISCLFGDGLGGIRKTHTCNLTCKFCYYHDSMGMTEKIPEDMWDIGDGLYYEEDIDLLLSIQKKPMGIAYVYLEPFREIEKYYGVVKKFHEAGVHQHMYTNGTLCTDENLKALAEAGLDEIRFNLGASNCSDKVIEAMRTAKKYFKAVGIETPMTPEFLETFMKKKEVILGTGIDFINCAELHLGEDNLNNYTGEKLYMSRRGYISPIWSREITMKMMKMGSEENWGIVVHDCSNHTKFAREINKNGKQGKQFGFNTYVSEFDRILPHIFIPLLQDESFAFLSEEKLPVNLTLDYCRDAILDMVQEDEDDFYYDED